MPTTMVVEEPTENAVHQEDNNFTTPASNGEDSSSQNNPVIRSLRIFDEFAKIKRSMEKFPLPANDVELKFPLPQTVADAITDSKYGSRMTDLLISLSLKNDLNILKLKELIEKAVEEHKHMVLENEPLWVYDEQKRTQVLNNVEYNKRFRELEMTLDNIIKVVAGENMPSDLTNPDMTSSYSMCNAIATRETMVVSVPPLCIIEIMMDVRLWSFTFGDMLSRAIVLESLARGDLSTYHGDIQVMSVEYHSPSPLVPTRQSYFARHCKQLTTSKWIVVDVPLDDIVPNPVTSFKRRQSGCLIEGLDRKNGYSKVTWIEHVECEHQVDVHPLLNPLAEMELRFDAKRWVETLMRQCKQLEVIIQRRLDNIVGEDVLLRLSNRMRRSFYGNLSGSTVYVWKPLPIPEAQDVLVRTNELENDEDGVTLTISVTFWLPQKQETVFGFLQDERNRPAWDMIARGYGMDGTFHLNNGCCTDRTVSVIKMLDEERKTATTTLLQETCYDPKESYVVYAPIATEQVIRILNEQCDAGEMSLTPSGFVIHQGEKDVGGSVVSALFHLFDKSSRLDFVRPETVHIVYEFVVDTLHAIRNSLSQLSSPPNP